LKDSIGLNTIKLINQGYTNPNPLVNGH